MMHVAENKVSSIGRATRAGGVATVLALSLAAIAHAGCSKSGAAPAENDCTASQALTNGVLTGASMPLKSLALTFDDGPGARTIELSQYLKSQGIRAGFFVWGQAVKNDGSGSSVLEQLIADGHLIANHTETHRSLTQHQPAVLTDAEIVDELRQVDTAISPFVKDGKFLFRPPYGHFDAKTFDVLEKTDMKKYVGPILWDVGGTMAPPNRAADTECWKPGTLQTVTGCGDLYLKEIDNVGKGIVLMHDPYFIEQGNPESGGTYQMVQYIVPKLKEKGYTFMRVDEVPAIAKLLPGGAGATGDAGVDEATTDPGQTGESSSGTDGTNPCP